MNDDLTRDFLLNIQDQDRETCLRYVFQKIRPLIIKEARAGYTDLFLTEVNLSCPDHPSMCLTTDDFVRYLRKHCVGMEITFVLDRIAENQGEIRLCSGILIDWS